MLDLNYIRDQFPGLKTDWILMDNAGGSQVCRPVAYRIQDFLLHTNAQLGATYYTSDIATKRVAEGQKVLAGYINAADPGEVVMGSSTSMLVRILALNMSKYLPRGSEIIVTNCDHEANIGAWREMEKQGFVIKTWKINQDSWELEVDELKKLLTDKTKIVAFTHTSNILGKINPVKEISRIVHEHGAMVCVDAVAYAPHRQIDVQDWDVDFYVFSFYKTYGPHYAMMFGKKKYLLDLPGNNHYFIGQHESAYKFQPGHVNFEFAWGMTGLIEYYKDVFTHHFPNSNAEEQDYLKSSFGLIAEHEQLLSSGLLDFLRGRKGVRLIGPPASDPSVRVPTISFVVSDRDSESIVLETDKHNIGIRFGDFYAARLIDELGLRKQNGVVRVSMVHYNTLEELDKVIEVLDQVL
jgi:cysteine desulfurase family protein (TIGR01976 family)